MSTGDQNDLLTRLKSALPQGWFGDVSPFRDAVLSGFANVLSSMYGLIQYAKAQTRIATATDGFLDLISFDFFGLNLLRKSGEADNPFRARILATLLREKATRKGITETLVALTGRAPLIFEPAQPGDTGGLGINVFVGVSQIGSYQMPYQAFITAFRPSTSGFPYVPGLGVPQFGLGVNSEIVSLDWVTGFVTDADIYQAISAAKPEGTTIWTKISN